MVRKLFATTALATLLATSAYAQDANTNAQNKMPEASSSTQATGNMQAQATNGGYLQKISNDQYLASTLNGKSVYPSNNQDAESIGDIQNFLVGSDGKVVAAVVDATINDESKTIAIPFNKISWAMGDDNEPRAVLTGDQQELASAPAFRTPSEQQASTAGVGTNAGSGMAGAGNTTAADGSAATGTGGAMAPAAGNAPAANTTAADSSSTSTPAAGTTASDSGAMQTADASNGEFPAMVGSDQYLSQNLIGANVRSGNASDGNDIGDVNDLVMSKSGQVDAAVIGVGGFLGIGEKDVAVPFDQLQLTRGEDQDPQIALNATKDQLTQAPSFDDDKDAQTANSSGSNSAATATTGNTMANNNAMGAGSDQAADTSTANNNTAAGTVAGTAAAGGTVAANTMAGDNTTTASTGGASNNQQMTPVTDPAKLTADNLLGTTVYGPNDSTVGDIGDIALNAQGTIDAVIIDVGGFLGIGEKPVAVAMDNLQFMQDANGSLYLHTQFTEDQLKNAPEYNSDTYAQNRDTMRLENPSDAAANTQQPANN